MGHLKTLLFAACYCASNKLSTTREEDFVVPTSGVLHVQTPVQPNNDVAYKKIKIEPEEQTVSAAPSQLSDSAFSNNDVLQNLKVEPKKEKTSDATTTLTDSAFSSNVKTEKSNNATLEYVKAEPKQEQHASAAPTTTSNFNFHYETAHAHDLDNNEQFHAVTKNLLEEHTAKHVSLTQPHNKPTTQKETSSAFQDEKISTEQINYFMTVLSENQDMYKCFMENYLRCVYPDELPSDVFRCFSKSNTVCLRVLRRKNAARKNNTTLTAEDTHDLGKLHTDFSAFYHNNKLPPMLDETNRRDTLFKRLYLSYENGTASYNVTRNKELSLDVYSYITENVIASTFNKEKNLLHVNTMFKDLPLFPFRIDEDLYTRKISIYNLLIYVSTRLDSTILTKENENQYFHDEIDSVFRQFLLPEESDYVHVLIFLSHLDNSVNKKKLFVKKLKSSKYSQPIAFYHFKCLYYVFYHIHRFEKHTNAIFCKPNFDFPGSLAFFSSMINRFLVNTLYILKYKKRIEVDVHNLNIRLVLLDYILKNGLKYLNKDITLEQHLETLLNDTVSLLRLQ